MTRRYLLKGSSKGDRDMSECINDVCAAQIPIENKTVNNNEASSRSWLLQRMKQKENVFSWS